MLIATPQSSSPMAGPYAGCFTMYSNVTAGLIGFEAAQGAIALAAFRWRAGNLANRQATGGWTKSFHNPVDQIRPVRVQNLVVIATDVWDTYQDMIPFMWSMGSNMGFLFPDVETEQWDWGFKPPTLKTYQEDAEYQNIPWTQEYYFNDLDSESEQFSFNPPIVVIISGFDEDELPDQSVLFSYEDLEKYNWGWMPPVLATSDNETIYGSAPQMRSYSTPPEIETEQFDWGFATQIGSGTQMMGFRGNVVYPSAMGFDVDTWGWLPPMVQVTLDDPHPEHRYKFDAPLELEGITEDFIVEMVSVDELYTGTINSALLYQDDDIFGFNTPVVTVQQTFDQDDLPLYTLQVSDRDTDQFSYQPVFIPVDELNSFIQSARQSTDEDQVQSEFFASDRIPEDYDQLVMINQLALYWNDEDSAQSTFFASEQYADADEQPIVKSWAWLQWTDDDKVDNTFFAREQYSDQDEQFVTAYVTRYQEDDIFGFNVPELLGELMLDEELEINNVPYPITHQIELDQYGQNAPFLTAIGFDDIDQYPSTRLVLDDVDTFGFQSEISEDLAFTDEDHFVGYQFVNQAEDVFGLNAPFITSFPSDDAPEQLLNKPYPIVAEDDLVFPASTILANMLYDADFNPTMQRSYYFGSEDLEKYNWGWLPPMTKVAEDDSPYDSRVQLQSYFIPAIEDEQFSFGVDKLFALGSEDIEQQLPQQSFYQHWQGTDEDSSQSTFFSQEQYGEGLEIQLPQQSFYFTYPEMEMFNWGFNPSLPSMSFDQDELPAITYQKWYHGEDFGQAVQFTALEQDEVPVVITQRLFHEVDFGQQVQFYSDTETLVLSGYTYINDSMVGTDVTTIIEAFTQGEETLPVQSFIFQDDETFGFQQQFVMATDDSPEHFPTRQLFRDEVEPFGFNPSLPNMDYTTPEERVTEWRMYVEGENWGYDTIHVQQLDEIGPLEQRPSVQDDEATVRVIQQPFSFGDEIDQLPNPPYPITHQNEFDQIGLNSPFIISQPFAWEESGIPANLPWPILDVTDYSDWIQNFTRIITIFGTGSVQIVTFSGFVTQDSGTGKVTNDSGSGSSGGVQGSGSVKSIKGN